MLPLEIISIGDISASSLTAKGTSTTNKGFPSLRRIIIFEFSFSIVGEISPFREIKKTSK